MSVCEEIENTAKRAAVSFEKLCIAAAMADDGSVLAALNVKNLTPKSAGDSHFTNFTSVVRAFRTSVIKLLVHFDHLYCWVCFLCNFQ